MVLLYNDVGIRIFEFILQSYSGRSGRLAARSLSGLWVRGRSARHHVPAGVEHLELAAVVMAEFIAFLASRV